MNSNTNKKPEVKANPEKDRQVKRIALPASARTLLALDLPFEMVDEQIYLEVVKNCLGDCREQAKSNKLGDLTASIEAALKKCQKILQKEDTKKNRKEKEVNDYELVELLKKVAPCDPAELLPRAGRGGRLQDHEPGHPRQVRGAPEQAGRAGRGKERRLGSRVREHIQGQVS